MIQNMQSHPPTSAGSGGLSSLEAEMLLSGREEKETLIGYIYNLNYWNFLSSLFLKQSLSHCKERSNKYIQKRDNLC